MLTLLLLSLSFSVALSFHSNGAEPFSSTSIFRGGGMHTKDQEVERRWNSLMNNCCGDWSGSIGWFDVAYDEHEEVPSLNPRLDNGERNMRLSFHPTAENENVANWVVYHARGQGVKEEVVLEKYSSGNDIMEKMQLFYCFQDGVLGRTGLDFRNLPVIEHGFWDRGTRRTVVLAYDKQSLRLNKICFLQQAKQETNVEFDVSASDPSHVSVLPSKPFATLEQLQFRWKTLQFLNAESITSDGIRQVTEDSNALSRLLGTGVDDTEPMLRLVLPNDVVLACPFHFGDQRPYQILMASQTKRGEIQVVEFHFVNTAIKRVTTSYWK